MDADKIKSFFIHHFEKMILVGVIAASGFLIYQGLGMPDFLQEHQPDLLANDATEVKSAIDENHNDAIIPDRIPTFNILEATNKIYTAVDHSSYKPTYPWERTEGQSIVRRQDPLLKPPLHLLAKGVATTIAIRGSKTDPDDYPLASLEDAEPPEKVEAKPKREPRRRRGRGNMDEMMDMEMMGMDMEMDMDMDMDMEMGGSMGGGGAGWRFSSDHDFGVRPMPTSDKKNPVPAVSWFIAGTAVVPHKEIYEAYELALKDADSYDPRRDTPMYFGLDVQRADVTDKPVDQLAEEDWEGIMWNREWYTRLAAQVWAGFAPEIVPSDYRDEALTTYIPPVLLDDYSTFSLHPLIPMIPQKELKEKLNPGQEEEEEEEFVLGEEGNLQLLAPGVRGGGMGGMDMMDMDMEMDMEMEMGGMMGGMMGSMMYGRGIEKDPVDYKLIRFYDFVGPRYPKSPEFGRKYVYRLRYSINDPNFPFNQMLQPKTSNLAPEVAKRVTGLMADAVAAKSRKALFERWSEWSEPSEPVSLSTLEQYFAGPVDPGTINHWQVAGKDVEYTRDPPKAKIVASKFDATYGARVPMRLEVTEGTVLSHKEEFADVVDPISMKVKKLPDAELVSGTTIVDLDGGGPLKIADDLTEPGMMLLFDQTGKLIVTDEVGDQEFYRIYSYADERGE